MKNHVRIHDQFFRGAQDLRKHFESRFSDAWKNQSGRFVWDWWHVKDQYMHLRTPAYHFFPPKILNAFIKQMREFGQTQLGCHDISPPWLSCYVDGCFQGLHTDSPHGPWAYVFSLCPKGFDGGRTLIMKPETLDYWKNFNTSTGAEASQLLKQVEPRFNRLLVFDPRLPHGVEKVSRAPDVREARLVIHGWFVNPKPFATGTLKNSQLKSPVSEILNLVEKECSNYGVYSGLLTLKIKINAGGSAVAETLSDTLVSAAEGSANPRLWVRHLLRSFGEQIRFPKSSGTTTLILPLIFQA